MRPPPDPTAEPGIAAGFEIVGAAADTVAGGGAETGAAVRVWAGAAIVEAGREGAAAGCGLERPNMDEDDLLPPEDERERPIIEWNE